MEGVDTLERVGLENSLLAQAIQSREIEISFVIETQKKRFQEPRMRYMRSA